MAGSRCSSRLSSNLRFDTTKGERWRKVLQHQTIPTILKLYALPNVVYVYKKATFSVSFKSPSASCHNSNSLELHHEWHSFRLRVKILIETIFLHVGQGVRFPAKKVEDDDRSIAQL